MREGYLSQDSFTFDQTEKGWRNLDNQGKYLEAAKLIEDYLKQNLKPINNQHKVSVQTIHFHAGQEYAMAGKQYYPRAIEHFAQAQKGRPDWDLYVKGSIAFLQQDKNKLTACAKELTKIANRAAQHKPNARLLQRFLKGLESDSTYSEAYG